MLALVAPREVSVGPDHACAAVMTSYLLLLTNWMTRYIPPTGNWATQVHAWSPEMTSPLADILFFLQMLQWLTKSCLIELWVQVFDFFCAFFFSPHLTVNDDLVLKTMGISLNKSERWLLTDTVQMSYCWICWMGPVFMLNVFAYRWSHSSLMGE